MSLIKYKKKRNLKESGEPELKIKSSKSKNIFVIHKHYASHLHWDFRLEIEGVLKSWAIPKEPPMKKEIKRLAIQVEDHPLEYANFQGEIPEGHYGAGKVEIWDKGTYELEDKKKNKIVFNLNGKKLKGKYVLVKTDYGSKPEKSWLFFKVK
jgi:bifunctional non-homologous end joining protein LigD